MGIVTLREAWFDPSPRTPATLETFLVVPSQQRLAGVPGMLVPIVQCTGSQPAEPWPRLSTALCGTQCQPRPRLSGWLRGDCLTSLCLYFRFCEMGRAIVLSCR